MAAFDESRHKFPAIGWAILGLESVAALPRSRWQASRGMRGRYPWNTQLGWVRYCLTEIAPERRQGASSKVTRRAIGPQSIALHQTIGYRSASASVWAYFHTCRRSVPKFFPNVASCVDPIPGAGWGSSGRGNVGISGFCSGSAVWSHHARSCAHRG